jgi:hypothetical protein
MYKALLTSIGIVTLVSIIFGVGTYLLAKTFWGGFLIAAVIQFIGGYLWNTTLERKDKMFAETLITQATDNPIATELSCAYCNVRNIVPLSLSVENVFKCKSCNQTNKVYIQFTTVRLTTPLTPNEALNEVPMLEEESTPQQRQTTINEPIVVKG